MSKTEKRIFRPEALARYMDQTQEAVFPKIIGPKLFPKLWILIVLLFAALFLIGWVPVKQESQLQAFLLPEAGSASPQMLAIKAHHLPKLKAGKALSVHQGSLVLLQGTIAKYTGPYQDDHKLSEIESKALSSVPNSFWPIALVTIQANELTQPSEQPRQVQVMLKHPPLRILNFWAALESKKP